MPKSKPSKLPAWLPDWANERLTFAPDAVLRRAMQVKPPKDWQKAIRASRKSRR